MVTRRQVAALGLAVLLCIGLAPAMTPLHAAYNAATIISNDRLDDGRYQLVVEFTGNAGEEALRRTVILDASTTVVSLRQWAIAYASGLQSARTLARSGALQVGQSFNLTPMIAPPDTAEQVWRRKAQRLAFLRSLGTTGTNIAAEIVKLASDVDATYVVGW